MKIDCHTHAYPVEVADKLIPRMKEVYGVEPACAATVQGLEKSMSESGIDHCLLLTVANRPEHVISTNDWAAQIQDEKENINCFGSIHPDHEHAAEELERIHGQGIRGIKLQPNAQGFYPDAKKMYPIYEKLSKIGMIAVFHVGQEAQPIDELYAHPSRIRAVLESFPKITVLLAHLGGYGVHDYIDDVLGFDKVWYDTAFIPGNIEDQKFRELVSFIGKDQVVFGSDFPWADPAESVEEIYRIFDEKYAQKILEKNPGRFLRKLHSASE